MGRSPPEPGKSSPKKREKLRLYKGQKLLAELSVSQKRIVVGSAPDAKIRLKKKGLPAEILILDATTRPVVLESRLPADKVFLNGWAISRGFFRPGDKIEFLGLTLEMVVVEAKAQVAKAAPAAAPRPQRQPQAQRADSTSPEAPAAARQSMDRARGRAAQMPPVQVPAQRTATDLTHSEAQAQAPPRREVTATEAETSGVIPGTASQVQLTDFTMSEVAPVAAVPSAQVPLEANPFEQSLQENPLNENSESRELNPAWDGNTGDLEDAIAAAEAEIAKMRTPAAPPDIEIEEIPALPREATNAADDILGPLLREPENTGEMPALFAPDLEEIAAAKPAPNIELDDRLRGRTREAREPLPTAGSRKPPSGGVQEKRREPAPPDPFQQQVRQAPTLGEDSHNPFAQQEQVSKQDPTYRELDLAEGSVDLDIATPPPGLRTRVTELPEPVPARPVRQPQQTPKDRPLPRSPREARGRIQPAQQARRPIPPQDVDFKVRRRSPFRGVMVAFLIIGLLGGTAYGVYRLGLAPGIGGGPEIAKNDTGSTTTNNKTTTSTRNTTNTNRTTTNTGSRNTGTRIARADRGTTNSSTGNETFEDPVDGREGARNILGDNRLDANTNVDVSGLDNNTGGNKLRAAREMDASELASIFVDAERPVVRKYYPELWDPAENYGAGTSAELEEGRMQIDTNRVNAKIRAQYPAIKSCLAKSTGFRGGRARVVVNFTIYPNGRVSEVSIPSSDVSGAAFRSCVVRTISTIKFPKPKDSSVVVIYPFVFTKN